MVRQNPTWGEARVASELALKLGIRVSPRTVRAYWPQDLSPNRGHPSQRWMTFVRNHGKAIVACDFVIAVTFSFRILYIVVVMEVGSRRILQVNVTSHPTSSWTLQQLREASPSDHSYRWLIHDRSGIFSEALDRDVKTLGVNVLKTPIRAPKANAYCERLIGSLRRECLDWFIPLNERHVRMLAREWAVHYNQGRPHRSLGPGIPDPPPGSPVTGQIPRHAVADGFSIKKKSILGGPHHEYRLTRIAA
jgi:transposase InsO family protein